MHSHTRLSIGLAGLLPQLLALLLLVGAGFVSCAPTNSSNGAASNGGSFRIQLRQRPMAPELVGLLEECYLTDAGDPRVKRGNDSHSLHGLPKMDSSANWDSPRKRKVCHAALQATAFMPFSGHIQIGEPPQLFEALFDTGSAVLFVLHSRCQMNGVTWNSGTRAKFASDKSRTYRRNTRERLSLSFGNGMQFNGWWVTDTVSLADARADSRSLTIENQDLGLICKIISPDEEGEQTHFEAMVGLSFATHRGKATLLESLYLNRLIDERVFSFHTHKLATKHAANSPTGELIFGHIDESLFTGDITWTPVVRQPLWEIRAHSVRLLAPGEPRAGPKSPAGVACVFGCQAVVDTGTAMIVGPVDEVAQLNRQLGIRRDRTLPGIYIAQRPCDYYRQLNYSLVVGIGNAHLEIGPEAYLMDVESAPGVQWCLSNLRSLEADRTGWILGAPFVSSFYSIFDYGNKQIGFAKPIRLNTARS